MYQVLAYIFFFAFIAAFSAAPELRLLADDEAVVSLSFSHAAKRVGECKRLSREELMALPPNMRKPDECPRERHSLHFDFFVDGDLVYTTVVEPSGLWSDGKSTIYKRLQIPSGVHLLRVRMNDSGNDDQFNYDESVQLDLEAEQNLVVYFDSSTQHFQFR